ncbi:hypothetical protein C8R45DRAFT_16195 [Mycena sanguinolenta]|nr:hypothetical protein C8R45DRAFT_16195 [Mycena sanguinolenta]
MSTPGSNRNKKYDDRRSKQSSDSVTFNPDTSGWSPEQHRRTTRYQATFQGPQPLGDYDLGAVPTGRLDVRMGNLGPIPEPRSPSRHQKFPSYSVTPGHYDGSGAVTRTPSHMSSPKMTNFPQNLGGRPPAPDPPPQQPSYHPAQAVPRPPDGALHMSMPVIPRPHSTVPQMAPRPASHADPRYSDRNRGY